VIDTGQAARATRRRERGRQWVQSGRPGNSRATGTFTAQRAATVGQAGRLRSAGCQALRQWSGPGTEAVRHTAQLWPSDCGRDPAVGVLSASLPPARCSSSVVPALRLLRAVHCPVGSSGSGTAWPFGWHSNSSRRMDCRRGVNHFVDGEAVAAFVPRRAHEQQLLPSPHASSVPRPLVVVRLTAMTTRLPKPAWPNDKRTTCFVSA
jgi:hypothetical protein